MAMEDANLTDSPLYVLYVDFVNAFGSVDHIRMAKILELQGLPSDAINLITDLYQGSKTIVGYTDPILHHGRGTVQGDPLSPLLFIQVTDPLLRWLEEANRG